MSVNVSNKTYHIKDTPYYTSGERIVGDFVSANHQFHEISIDTYEGDLEIWYLDRNDPSGSVLAFANGTWEIEYKYITFNNNVLLSDEDFQRLTWAYDEYIPTRELYATYQGVRKPMKINSMLKGTFAYGGTAYPFENLTTLQTPQNVSASGTTLEFDPVDGAEKYEVFADGNSIGEKNA